MAKSELETIKEQIEVLEKRICILENIINGSKSKKAGRKEKLTLEQKNEIINKHTKGSSYSVLAKEYNVAKGTIARVCTGHTDSSIIRV